MTLPASPPITLAQVRAEFGAPPGTPLHAFIRGGTWVPNIAANASVPNTAPIALHQLCGATAYVPMSGSVPNVVGATSSGITNDTIGNANVSVSNGQPPYSYNTTFVSGTAFGITNPTTPNPTFIRSGKPGAGSVSGNYQTVITDATLATLTKPFTVTDNRT